MKAVLTEVILEDARTFIEAELDKALEKIMLQARVRVMQNIQFMIREEVISDRLVMTLEIGKKGTI